VPVKKDLRPRGKLSKRSRQSSHLRFGICPNFPRDVHLSIALHRWKIARWHSSLDPRVSFSAQPSRFPRRVELQPTQIQAICTDQSVLCGPASAWTAQSTLQKRFNTAASVILRIGDHLDLGLGSRAGFLKHLWVMDPSSILIKITGPLKKNRCNKYLKLGLNHRFGNRNICKAYYPFRNVKQSLLTLQITFTNPRLKPVLWRIESWPDLS